MLGYIQSIVNWEWSQTNSCLWISKRPLLSKGRGFGSSASCYHTCAVLTWPNFVSLYMSFGDGREDLTYRNFNMVYTKKERKKEISSNIATLQVQMFTGQTIQTFYFGRKKLNKKFVVLIYWAQSMHFLFLFLFYSVCKIWHQQTFPYMPLQCEMWARDFL